MIKITNNKNQKTNKNNSFEIPPVITLGMNKGGVGKTTMAVNLASTFNKAGYDVLIIGVDPQNHVREWITREGNLTIGTIINKLLSTKKDLVNTYLAPTDKKSHYWKKNNTFDIITYGDEVETTSALNMFEKRYPLEFDNMIKYLINIMSKRKKYDIIIIDSGNDVANTIKRNIYNTSDLIIPVVNKSKYNLHSFKEYIESIEMLSLRSNHKIFMPSVILNKIPSNHSLSETSKAFADDFMVMFNNILQNHSMIKNIITIRESNAFKTNEASETPNTIWTRGNTATSELRNEFNLLMNIILDCFTYESDTGNDFDIKGV